MSRTKRAFETKRSFSSFSGIRLRQVCDEILWGSAQFKCSILLCSYCLALPGPAQATATLMSKFELTCDSAAQHAAKETGVPLDVLMAITRTETGFARGDSIQPWPWTVNMQGRGVWFDTKSEALTYVFDHFKAGARSFDVGCFQINYRWHGASFASIEDMFDPSSNALYAASFLKNLYAESGDWTVAAGAFHSRTAIHADRYIVRFVSMLAELDASDRGGSQERFSSTVDHQGNRFPLLQKGQAAGLASLVPLKTVEGIIPVIDLTVKDWG